MARDLRSSNVVDLEVRAGALGTELIPCELNGRDVYLTASQISALGGGTSIRVSDSDPGATGAGSGWLLVDASDNPLAFFIRNNADDGWLSDGALPQGALDASVELADDLEVGEGSGTFARILVLPTAVDSGFVTVFQCKFEGDAYPRLVLVSDGSFCIGDGTSNPLQSPQSGLLPSGNGTALYGNGSVIRLKDGTIEIAPLNNELTLPGIIHVSEVLCGANDVPDADLSAGIFGLYLDDTIGATQLLIKAKDAGGSVVTGSLPLS